MAEELPQDVSGTDQSAAFRHGTVDTPWPDRYEGETISEFAMRTAIESRIRADMDATMRAAQTAAAEAMVVARVIELRAAVPAADNRADWPIRTCKELRKVKHCSQDVLAQWLKRQCAAGRAEKITVQKYRMHPDLLRDGRRD